MEFWHFYMSFSGDILALNLDSITALDEDKEQICKAGWLLESRAMQFFASVEWSFSYRLGLHLWTYNEFISWCLLLF